MRKTSFGYDVEQTMNRFVALPGQVSPDSQHWSKHKVQLWKPWQPLLTYNGNGFYIDGSTNLNDSKRNPPTIESKLNFNRIDRQTCFSYLFKASHFKQYHEFYHEPVYGDYDPRGFRNQRFW
jgi:hypothetical protein